MADLRVVAANLHNEVAAVAALAAMRFDVALVSEAHRRGRELVAVKGYRYLTGSTFGPSREVGILVSKRVKRLTLRGYWHEFASAATRRFKRVGKERWGHVALIQLPDKTRVACIAVHPVAGPKVLASFDPEHTLAKRYAAHMRWLEQAVAYHRSRRHEVVIGGDVNMRETWERPWSPHAIFNEHRMRWFWDGLDCIAWTPGLSAVLNRANRDFPSDHPALRVDLVRVNRKRKRD